VINKCNDKYNNTIIVFIVIGVITVKKYNILFLT